ncbi:hypothetical protein PVL30_002165 [Lodderomyces elongisporus]|uniref:uncharacterized protein n=1 Tax=Lodderomyces elongisporus TaxID=36914 RepID=UPI00291D6F29|nr:uncharacterized protein PVL30_002164 [Lodderomyces elongisporus]XP_060975302.1 uncharacterized protein PVL30_002165 [Lodderomyces elongisporus]WLF78426.1 hypothetical protein PVL30_002164 [Lodderomyces elongisporus]WLF78427.1 hypothetical protein PVL30_002165 [Lodderomyces elongisporus]
MSFFKNAFNTSPKSKGEKPAERKVRFQLPGEPVPQSTKQVFQNLKSTLAKGFKPSQTPGKSPSGAPSSETPVKKLTKKEAERFLLVEGIHKSIADCLRRTWKYDETFSVFLRHQEYTTNIESYHAKSFQRVRKSWGCSESTYLQSFASMEDSITKIGSTAYKSTDGKFLIYKISEEHSEDIRRELPRMGSHYKEASLILPHFQLLKMNFGGEETIYAVSPAYEHQATEGCPTGNVRFPLLTKEREDILHKLQRDTTHLIARNKTGYKLLVGVERKVGSRPGIQVRIVDYHRTYTRERGFRRFFRFFRFGGANVKTPEEYAAWLIKTLDQHIEVIEGELHLENVAADSHIYSELGRSCDKMAPLSYDLVRGTKNVEDAYALGVSTRHSGIILSQVGLCKSPCKLFQMVQKKSLWNSLPGFVNVASKSFVCYPTSTKLKLCHSNLSEMFLVLFSVFFPGCVTGCVADGVAGCVADGVAGCVADVMSGCVAGVMSGCVADVMSGGVTDVMSGGVADVMSGGVAVPAINLCTFFF